MKHVVLAVLLVFLIAAPSSPQSSNDKDPNQAWTALSGTMRQMHTAMMSVRTSGESDADFVNLMLPHHQAAIEMAKVQLMYGKDPQMRRLAQEIITDQQSEIDLMQLWLKQRKVPATFPPVPSQKEQLK